MSMFLRNKTMMRVAAAAMNQGSVSVQKMMKSSSVPRLKIKTFNKISPVGLGEFDPALYDVSGEHTDGQAIVLRSHKLTAEDVPHATRCIARCGAGTNNCQVDLMTELGVPVFNTPGSNANAVKELVVCSLLLASRGILDGAAHMQKLHAEGIAAERIEKDKSMFGGQEVAGKTLGVVGLGNIGAAVADAAADLGMKVVGYDPALSVEMALKIDGTKVTLVNDLSALAAASDYVSLHVPFIAGITENLIGENFFMHMKPTTHILNFARGGIVDSAAYRKLLDAGASSKYICDFAEDALWDHPNVTIIPHLGASTEEAEITSSVMAAKTTRKFLETGCIENSVNFPSAELAERAAGNVRLCVSNVNTPGVLSSVFDVLSQAGLNIEQQYSTSNDKVGYHLIDFTKQDSSGELKSYASLQETLTMLPNVLNTRFISGTMGQGYAKQVDGSYMV